MSTTVPVPINVLDPYEKEKSNEKPVLLRLLFTNGRTVTVSDGYRVMTTPPTPLQFEGKLFVFRGVDENVRLYREQPVLDIAPAKLSPLQAEYIALTERIENPILKEGFGVKKGVTSVEHGTMVVQRQKIAFHLVDTEIARILRK